MTRKTLSRSLLSFLKWPPKGAGPKGAPGFPRGPEDREMLFREILEIAHRHGLHVAPSVPLTAVFSVRDGRRSRAANRLASALGHERVDLLLLDRRGEPCLALDYCAAALSGRFQRRKDRVKDQLFAQAGLPLVVLRGPAVWDRDSQTLLQKLASLTPPASNSPLPRAQPAT